MKKIVLFAATAALLAACGGKGTDSLSKKKAELDSLKTSYKEMGVRIKEVEEWLSENDTTVKRNLPVVTTLELKVGPFAHYVDVHGAVKADKAATLSALAGGRVRRIHVSPGDHVTQGQTLVSIDNDMVSKQIDQAQAGVELARTAFEKQDRLWQQKIGSEMQFLQVKSQKEQAEAGLKALQEQQRLTNITAPFAGTVDEVMLREGDLAAPGVAAARVVDLSTAQLEADVPEGYLRSMRKGSAAKVIFPSLQDTLEANVDHVGEFIDPSNRTFKVTVRMPKGEEYTRPNLLSDISILDAKNDSAIVVPSSTVLEDVSGNNYVFVVDLVKGDEGKARKVMVKRLSEYKGNMSIAPAEVGGLKGGDAIVEDGAKNVSNGQSVRVVKH